MASHLQKYRLYLKRISCVANQQASMVAALGSADQSYLRMGGSGHFHSNAFRSFLASGIISNLNSPAGLNGHGFSPSGLLQLGQSQSLNNSSGDQFKFQSAITLVNQNILQGMPMSIGYDHLQNSKGSNSRHIEQEKEAKKGSFRKYLESSGVVDALTKVLVALYEQNDKPSSALEFIQQNLSCPSNSGSSHYY
ncbi:unnamed protein product [Vicia faba]|uniref:Uncharacterized protein n=1 Tax=Vicia faba TaxID=3906 RepID=A0AAV1B7M5_VICFA|nr:unnamed protein product [Vicia faba]CAI8618614.1 unnamed protein product [Vicia faba]CAI8618616.1 unnamed protein product [Vicia faba]